MHHLTLSIKTAQPFYSYVNEVEIGKVAIRALYSELMLDPKPGLVTPFDNGSHHDMNASTLFRSLFALRSYFPEIIRLGKRGALYNDLKKYGITAENRMLKATGGINTHRGAIFNLGLLSAAAGYKHTNVNTSEKSLGEVVIELWSDEILDRDLVNLYPTSHGEIVAQTHGAGGARAEAAAGFPTLYNIALPMLKKTIAQTSNNKLALTQTLFALIAKLEDTNILFRGGSIGLDIAQKLAKNFLNNGGVYQTNWLAHAKEISQEFKNLNLSPGGSADLLSATWFVYTIETQ